MRLKRARAIEGTSTVESADTRCRPRLQNPSGSGAVLQAPTLVVGVQCSASWRQRASHPRYTGRSDDCRETQPRQDSGAGGFRCKVDRRPSLPTNRSKCPNRPKCPSSKMGYKTIRPGAPVSHRIQLSIPAKILKLTDFRLQEDAACQSQSLLIHTPTCTSLQLDHSCTNSEFL